MSPLTDSREESGWWYCTWCAGWKSLSDPPPVSPDGKHWRCVVCTPPPRKESMKASELTPAFCRERTLPLFRESPLSVAKLVSACLDLGVTNTSPPELLHRWMLKVSQLFPADGWCFCAGCQEWRRPGEPAGEHCRSCVEKAQPAVAGSWFCEWCRKWKVSPAVPHRTEIGVAACEDCINTVPGAAPPK